MYRQQPSMNKICSKKWEDKVMEIHRQKLDTIKPTHDNRSPQHFSHLITKPKRQQIMEERYTEIEKENRLLLDKMTIILAKQGPSSLEANSSHQQSKTLSPLPPLQHKPRSLNRQVRHNQLVRIMDENAKLLKRLQSKSPNYSVKQWHQQDKANYIRVQKISKFPNILRKSANYPEMSHSRFSLNQSTIRKFNHTNMSSVGLIAIDRMMYSGEQLLGKLDAKFHVEITLTKEEALVIVSVNKSNNQKDIIEIQPYLVPDVIKLFGEDFQKMASYLQASGDKVVLLNPKITALSSKYKSLVDLKINEDGAKLDDVVNTDQIN